MCVHLAPFCVNFTCTSIMQHMIGTFMHGSMDSCVNVFEELVGSQVHS